jgi:cytoplasmic iron level regulating protein YaaA (DUF328/UPF0246 family)
MLFLLSPAKKLQCDGVQDSFPVTEAMHLDEASYLVKKLKSKTPRSLKKMMGISDDLANLNHERFQHWTSEPDAEQAMQAVLLFQGDVYQGLEAAAWNKKDMDYAQSSVRILSGLYGMLRPLDKVMPYRLEMGSDFKVTAAKTNLYKFWGDVIKQDIESDLAAQADQVIVNLASNEYAKAARLPKIDARIISPEFRDEHNGQYKMISFFAKKARGMMSRYAVKNKLKNVEDLKGFDYEGYYFNNKLSVGDKWVFTRDKR